LDAVEWLRKIAECNLCPKCFKIYEQSIEPNIQATVTGLLYRPMNDWLQTEEHITQIVMRIEGVFKGNIIVISFTEGSEIAKLVDEQKFRRIEKWSMAKKIDFLRKKGIVREATFELLDRARKTRNRIHNLIAFGREDYEIFYYARVVTSQLWNAVTMSNQAEVSKIYSENAEKNAKMFLEKIDKPV
jgi:hypothetical protein